MAATWIKPLHVNKGKTIAQTLADRTDYAENPDKTQGGNLVRGFACDPHTADEEFLLSKKEYEHITGRDQGRRNILAYHIRQAFKPGEITPEAALEAGYELAARFTKNKHAYIVAVHTDKKHIHCHIVFNSTSLDCTRKFRNFWGSSFAIRRLSDLICMERGLSVIENPKPSKGRDYGDWLVFRAVGDGADAGAVGHVAGEGPDEIPHRLHAEAFEVRGPRGADVFEKLNRIVEGIRHGKTGITLLAENRRLY